MARSKYIDTNPRFLAVDLAQQLRPGTFEHALNHLLDHAIDLSHFDARFRNDETGATVSPPAMLLKVVLFAYSQGIVSSRGIARACAEHVTCIARVVAAVVAIGDSEGLIGREMFAIDGVKLPTRQSRLRDAQSFRVRRRPDAPRPKIASLREGRGRGHEPRPVRRR